MVTEFDAGTPYSAEEMTPSFCRFRRMSSRLSSFSYDEPEIVEIAGEATLCFDEAGIAFQGVIVTDDRSNYSIEGKKIFRKRSSASTGMTKCGCADSQDAGEQNVGVPVSFDIRIRDFDNLTEYHLKKVHGRNGELCKFTCSNVNFTSMQVHRGHKANMIAQECLGHKLESGNSHVYRGPIYIRVEGNREQPRHWVL